MKNIKKIICLFCCLSAVILSFSGCSPKTESKLEYKIVNNEVIITKYTDSTQKTEIIVPDEIEGFPVTEIADFSLFNCESLKKIYIGKNVSKIGEWSMTNNQRLEQFAVDDSNEYFCSVDGVLYSKDMKTIIYYPPARNIKFDKYGEAQNTTQYEIADGVETVRTKAFYKCYYVDSITIPNSVKYIEEKAFHRSSSLTEIKLPLSLTFIGKDAFAYCDKLEKVTIPESVKEIDEYAFFNCSNMKELVMLPKEENMILQDNWYPTSNGKQIKECEIIWKNN